MVHKIKNILLCVCERWVGGWERGFTYFKLCVCGLEGGWGGKVGGGEWEGDSLISKGIEIFFHFGQF